MRAEGGSTTVDNQCVDIDECNETSFQDPLSGGHGYCSSEDNGGVCTNETGSYTCSCKEHYIIDTDSSDPHVCKLSCPTGYLANDDNSSCSKCDSESGFMLTSWTNNDPVLGVTCSQVCSTTDGGSLDALSKSHCEDSTGTWNLEAGSDLASHSCCIRDGEGNLDCRLPEDSDDLRAIAQDSASCQSAGGEWVEPTYAIVEMALDEFFPAGYKSAALPTWYTDIWGPSGKSSYPWYELLPPLGPNGTYIDKPFILKLSLMIQAHGTEMVVDSFYMQLVTFGLEHRTMQQKKNNKISKQITC